VGAGEVLELLEGHHGALRRAPREARFTERQSPDFDGVSPSQIGQCPRAPAESDPGGHGTLRQLQRGRGHPVLSCGRTDHREQTPQHQRDQQLTHDHLLLLLGSPPTTSLTRAICRVSHRSSTPILLRSYLQVPRAPPGGARHPLDETLTLWVVEGLRQMPRPLISRPWLRWWRCGSLEGHYRQFCCFSSLRWRKLSPHT